MFMTLKCSGHEDASEMQNLHATDRMGRPNNTSCVACNSCRKKKLRCSREKVGCRRCQQRGIRCVYDAQKGRGSSNTKQQEGASAQPGRSETLTRGDGSNPQPGTVVEGSGHPWNDNDTSSIQVAIPNIAPASRHHVEDQRMSLVSDAGSRSGGSSSGSSSNRSNKESTHHNRPQDQQENPEQGVFQADVAEQNSQPIASCPEDPDLGFFLNFTDEDLNNAHDRFDKLIDPFGADGLISHNDISVENSSVPTLLQLGDFNSKKRSPGGSGLPSNRSSSKQGSLTSLDQPMRTSSSKSSSVSYSKSNTSDITRASSSTSSRNGMDIDTESCEDSNNSYDDGDCECTDTALQILEQVVIPPVGADWAMAEDTIFLLKNNISRCLYLSQCRGCRQESGICMLTLVIYEKLVTGFEEVAQWWAKQSEPQGVGSDSRSRRERHRSQLQLQQQQQQGLQQLQQQQRWSGSRQLQQHTRITMGRYQIDSAEEHRAVFATIITCQLQRLSGLSKLMMENSKRLKWLAHVHYGEGLRLRMIKLEETWKC